MTHRSVIKLLTFYLIFHQIQCYESSLQCWRCEVVVQSNENDNVFLDDCDAQFDFTQHEREHCNGKCWKSVDLIDMKQNDNRTFDTSLIKYRRRSQLKSSRRCYSSDELVRAAELGINTSDGCRQVRKENQKLKEVCFCSDQDLCNGVHKVNVSYFYIFTLFVSVYSFVILC